MIKIKRNLKSLVLGLILGLSVINVQAQIQTITTSISSSTSATYTGSPVVSPFITAVDLEDGLISSPVSVAVKSNRLWKMNTSITGITSEVIANGPSVIVSPLLPINIAWGVTNISGGVISVWNTFESINSNAQIKNGSRGSSNIAGNSFDLRYKITPGYTVDPANYTISLVHTLSTN